MDPTQSAVQGDVQVLAEHIEGADRSVSLHHSEGPPLRPDLVEHLREVVPWQRAAGLQLVVRREYHSGEVRLNLLQEEHLRVVHNAFYSVSAMLLAQVPFQHMLIKAFFLRESFSAVRALIQRLVLRQCSILVAQLAIVHEQQMVQYDRLGLFDRRMKQRHIRQHPHALKLILFADPSCISEQIIRELSYADSANGRNNCSVDGSLHLFAWKR